MKTVNRLPGRPCIGRQPACFLLLLLIFLQPGLFAQNEEGGSGDPDDSGDTGDVQVTDDSGESDAPGLDRVIEAINNIVRARGQKHSQQFFQGNKLLITATPLSDEEFLAGDISPAQPLFAPPLAKDTIIQQINITLPDLPQLLEHPESSYFNYFTTSIQLLYFLDHTDEVPTFQRHASRVEIVGSRRPTARRFSSRPGSPILLWTNNPVASDVFSDAPSELQESRILLRFLYDKDGAETESSLYRYDSLGQFYELEKGTAGAEKRFVTLDEGSRGSRVLIYDKDWALLSLRSFDDQGRLQYSQSPSDSTGAESSTRIRHLEDGEREEITSFARGGDELLKYDASNNLLLSQRNFSDGRSEERNFAYTEEGEILQEEFQGTLGKVLTTYQYDDGELSRIETLKDDVISRLLVIDGEEGVETRYLRGEPVLRIYLENDTRIAEEELFEGEIIRRREYGSSESDSQSESDSGSESGSLGEDGV